MSPNPYKSPKRIPPSEHADELKWYGIKGWLIVLMLVLLYIPIMLISRLYHHILIIKNEEMGWLMNPESEFYSFPHKILVYSELTISALFLATWVIIFILFFKKKKSFKKCLIITFSLFIIFPFVDFLIASQLDTFYLVPKNYLKTTIDIALVYSSILIIMIAYFKKSKRVRYTFIH